MKLPLTTSNTGPRFITEGNTDQQITRFKSFTVDGTSYREICKNDLLQVVVGKLFSSEEEFHVQALRDFVMPPESSPS